MSKQILNLICFTQTNMLFKEYIYYSCRNMSEQEKKEFIKRKKNEIKNLYEDYKFCMSRE